MKSSEKDRVIYICASCGAEITFDKNDKLRCSCGSVIFYKKRMPGNSIFVIAR